jgi:NADPH-dependent ferric siderophore reductase
MTRSARPAPSAGAVRRRALSGYVYRVLEVVRTELVTPGLRRIVLGGPELAGFGTDRAGPNIKIYFPRRVQRRPLMPEPDGQGRLWWPPDDLRPIMRTYSVRRFDPDLGALTVDFALHGGGVAGRWAASARVGDLVGVTGPGGPTHRLADWNLLVADHAGLPGASVILEWLPRDARGLALLQVPRPDDRQHIDHPPGLELRWIDAGDPSRPGAALTEAVRAAHWRPGDSMYAWVSAESEIVRAARRYLREERGLGRGHDLSIGYWRRGLTESEYDRAHRNDRDDD